MTLNSDFSYLVLTIIALVFVVSALLYLYRTKLRSARQHQPIAHVENIVVRTGFSHDVVLHVAASVGQQSEHVLAQAIVNHAKKQKLPINAVNDFKSHTGYGLTGIVDGRIIALGSQILMQELGINIPTELKKTLPENQTGSVVYISINSYLAGIVSFTRTR